MSKLEKFGLFFMLLGVSSFRDDGWSGGVGVLFLVAGWLMFSFPASAPNTRLQADGAVCPHKKGMTYIRDGVQSVPPLMPTVRRHAEKVGNMTLEEQFYKEVTPEGKNNYVLSGQAKILLLLCKAVDELRCAEQSLHQTGLTPRQKETIRQIIQSALDTGSA